MNNKTKPTIRVIYDNVKQVGLSKIVFKFLTTCEEKFWSFMPMAFLSFSIPV